MWKTWTPDPQASQPSPVDWAAKAAEWARQQAAKAPPPPPPPPAEQYHDIVENEAVMEDAMPTNTAQSNEWSAVTDPALEQYSSTGWNGAAGEQYQGYYNAEGYEGYKNENSGYAEQYYGADGAGAGGESYEGSGYQAEYSQGYPNSQVPFTKHGEERGIPPPPTHTLPLGRGFREQPPVIPHNIQMGVVEAPRRKALPAWIRDGLSKMEKDKSKNQPEMELTRRPRTTEVTGYNKMVSRGMTTAIQRNKISGYSVLQDSGASSEEKEDDHESDDEVKPKMDPVLFVRRSLTELLLEATNSELRVVVMECLQQEQAIKQLDELCKKKENNGTNGLDLVSYNNQSSSDSDSSSEDSSSSESNKVKQTIIPPVTPQSVLNLKLDSNKENSSSSKRKPSNSSPTPTRSQESESKPSKSEKVSSKPSEKARKDTDEKSSKSNRKQKSSKKSSRSDEKHHSSDEDRKRKKSRLSSSTSSDGKERSSRRSKQEKLSKRNSSNKKEEKSKKKDDKKIKKEETPSKKEKIKELNKKIEKATREVEKKTKSSKKRPEPSTSPSSSSSSSPERKTKKKSKSVKKRESSSSSRRKRKSSDSSDYGYKFSSPSPDKKHKTRKR